MTETQVSAEMIEAGMKAFGDTEIVGGPPSFTRRALAEAYLAMRQAEPAQGVGEAVEAWQPIETAPKDGDDILVEWFEGGTMLVVSWDETEGRWATLDGPSYSPTAFKAWRHLPLPAPPSRTK